MDSLQAIRKQNFTILLVEQSVNTALEIADRCYILEKGRIKAQGTIDEIRKNPEILHQYLGVPDEK